MSLFNLFTEAALRFRIWYYEWALQNIEPGHEDVPEIILHLMNLSDRLDNMKGQS